jgi:hypothetical protein
MVFSGPYTFLSFAALKMLLMRDNFESEEFCEYVITFVRQLAFDVRISYILELDQALMFYRKHCEIFPEKAALIVEGIRKNYKRRKNLMTLIREF